MTMARIEIKETGSVEEITVIDPNTYLDWSGDLIGNAYPEIEGYNDDGEMIMTQANFDWWDNYCIEYQQADELVHEFFENLGNDCQDQFAAADTEAAAESAYYREMEMQEWFDNVMGSTEFNDLPAAMIQFVTDNVK